MGVAPELLRPPPESNGGPHRRATERNERREQPGKHKQRDRRRSEDQTAGDRTVLLFWRHRATPRCSPICRIGGARVHGIGLLKHCPHMGGGKLAQQGGGERRAGRLGRVSPVDLLHGVFRRHIEVVFWLPRSCPGYESIPVTVEGGSPCALGAPPAKHFGVLPPQCRQPIASSAACGSPGIARHRPHRCGNPAPCRFRRRSVRQAAIPRPVALALAARRAPRATSAPIRSQWRDLQGRDRWLEARLRHRACPSAEIPVLVDHHMMGNGKEPASKRAAPLIETRQTSKRLRENLAGGVFRCVPVSQPPEAMGVNRIDIAKVERREGLRIGLGTANQLTVGAKILRECLMDRSLVG